MSNLKRIEKFVLSEIATDLGRQALDADEDLIEQRIIDSLGILKLVSYLEDEQGIEVFDEDIIPENFQTLHTIDAFIERKKPGGTKSESRSCAGGEEPQSGQKLHAVPLPGHLAPALDAMPLIPPQ